MLARTEWSFDQMEILKNCGPFKERDLSEHSKQMKFTSNIVCTYKHICLVNAWTKRDIGNLTSRGLARNLTCYI